ncbi:MAG: TolC family protein [Bacteroidetes bacterium]|nr:TolC family protein [Bacteroidota bacterium]
MQLSGLKTINNKYAISKNIINNSNKYIEQMSHIKIIIIGIFLASSFVNKAQKVLTLEDAMNIALENSPEIKQSRLTMEQNQEYLNAQLAMLKSHFSFDVTPIEYSNSEEYNEYYSQWYSSENTASKGGLLIQQPIKWTDGTLSLRNNFQYRSTTTETFEYTTDPLNPTKVTNTYTGFDNNLYLSYNQPLFTYNRVKLNLKRQELALENSTLSYSIQMLNIEKQVTQAFYTIYQKQMAVKIKQEEYENQKVSFDIIKSKVEADLSAKEELLQGELNLATSKSNLDNAVVDLENAMDQFKKLIGISLYDDIEINTNIEYQPVIVDLEKAINNGLSQRLELTQRKIELNNAEFDLIETKATNEFRGDVDLSLGIMGNNENFGNIYDKPTRSPQVGVTFSIPIFDWGERKARIRAAELKLESREINYKSQEDDIILNIRQTYRSLQNLNTQIKIAEQNEKNAQLTYEINLERYRNGDLTSIDLERYQNQLSQKKMDLANALISYKLELLNMKIQSLWDFEHNTSFVPQELQQNIKTE